MFIPLDAKCEEPLDRIISAILMGSLISSGVAVWSLPSVISQEFGKFGEYPRHKSHDCYYDHHTDIIKKHLFNHYYAYADNGIMINFIRRNSSFPIYIRKT